MLDDIYNVVPTRFGDKNYIEIIYIIFLIWCRLSKRNLAHTHDFLDKDKLIRSKCLAIWSVVLRVLLVVQNNKEMDWHIYSFFSRKKGERTKQNLPKCKGSFVLLHWLLGLFKWKKFCRNSSLKRTQWYNNWIIPFSFTNKAIFHLNFSMYIVLFFGIYDIFVTSTVL